MLRLVADASLLGQFVHTRQAHARLPAVEQEQQEALDLLGQFVLDYLPTLASTAVRNHAVSIGGAVLTFECQKQETDSDPARRYRI
jgi:hypothetical protein